ncbi:MAG: hypothetical protein HYW64_01925, partial [Candidatus Levybacteria bacterium]|nr:hypothetical protein [Candidatus Levybacteria bacterium]
ATQKFIEIQNIQDDVVILSGGNACLVIEVQTANFTLLSKEEQDAKIFSYASLLNSLSFPIQILVKNKRVDISSYVKLLETEIQKQNAETKKKNYMKQYKDYVSELVKTSTVLDKKFYIIISYSYLEAGAHAFAKQDFIALAKETLHTKANSLYAQLARLNLRAKTLQKEELINLFYAVFNAGAEQEIRNEADIKAPVVSTLKTI